MINDRYHVKIVPQKGDTVYRFWIRRRHIAAVAGVFALVVFGSLVFAGVQVLRAQTRVARLQRQAEQQRAALQAIDSRTDALRQQLQRVQKQNNAIRALIGAPSPRPHAAQKTSWVRRGMMLQVVESHVKVLSAASAQTLADSDRMKQLALHVLNIRHLRDLARAKMLAAIPSIDPVDGADVIGCFCYRSYPDTEFHEGVDLGADYGEIVRAAAAGTVVAASYDGGYGEKIDIDHGNGYHTWYAHLSRMDVTVGQQVYKGETIGEVGATGFATGPHLHYQVMYQGTPVDPTPFLHGVPPNVLARVGSP
jgi:murein DD-endopeptidase MepM/ murein hydrolase activator NlpD